MSIHQTEKIGPYFFIKTTFQLLNLEIHPSFQPETTSLNSISHLSRLLKSKNGALKTSQALRLKQPSKFEKSTVSVQDQLDWKGMDEIAVRIKDQLERVRSLMRERQIKNKHSLKKKSYLEEQKFKQLMQNQGITNNADHLCAYFQELGQFKAGKLAEELQLYGESCQSYQELLQTFKQMMLDDQPSTIFSNKVTTKRRVSLNIRQYGEVFQQMLTLRQKRDQAKNDQNFLDEFNRLKFPKSIEKNQFYKNIQNQLKKSLKKQKKMNNKFIFSDLQGLIRFLDLQPIPQKYSQPKDALTYESLWDKLDDLIRRGPVHHDMIGVHLLQFNENELYNFFKATLNGKFQKFNKNILLFETNQHYRNFIKIIERTYSEELIRQNISLSRREITGVVKELLLRLNLKENIQNQLKLIRQYAIKLSAKLRFKAKKVSNYPQLQLQARQLICLGELVRLIEIMIDSQKMNSLEAMLILAHFINVNIKSSQLLFFNSQPVETLYCQLLQRILKVQVKLSFRQMTIFLKLFAPLLPFQKVPTSDHLRQMLTCNKNLFEYIVQNEGFTQYFSYLNFDFSNFSQILQTLMQKHSNYAYCMELALSLLIPISQYIQICYSKSKSHKLNSPSQGKLNHFSDEFHCKQLQRLQFRDKNISFVQRFKLLIDIIKNLQKVNAMLSKNKIKRQAYYEQIHFCNEMLSHLSKKHIIQIIWRNWDVPKKQIIEHTDQLTNQLTNLTFTFSLLRIRYCILKSRFEEMVDLFNEFLQKIASHFTKILINIQLLLKEDQGEELGLMYLRQITQCLLVLKRNKTKVITKNRYLFKVLCSNISELLKGIKEKNKEEVQLIEAQLKQTANQIISL